MPPRPHPAITGVRWAAYMLATVKHECAARSAVRATLLAAGCAACAPAKDAGTVAAEPTDRAGWRARLRWPDACEEGFALAEGRGTGVESYPLPGGRRLAQVACAPGAYQGSFVYHLVPPTGDASGPLAFPDVVDAGGDAGAPRLTAERTTEVIGLPTFDATTSRLRVLRRFRGVGDCGVELTYTFARDAPTLVALRGKLACDGDATPPESWPVIEPPR